MSLIAGLACGLQTIVWNEHKSDFKRETITSHFNHVHIVIAPQANGLFRVQLLQKDTVWLYIFSSSPYTHVTCVRECMCR